MLREFWERVTGREAERERERRQQVERRLDIERDHRRKEIRQVRLAALDAGVFVYRETTQRIDVTSAADDARREVDGVYRWRGREVEGDEVAAARDAIEGEDERE